MQQPKAKAKDIIDTITQAMNTGIEEMIDKALAPSIYRVYLHAEDYDRLYTIFPKIAEQAKENLDKELDRRNRVSRGLQSWLKRLFGKKRMHYESAEGDWSITFYEHSDESIGPGVIDIYYDYAAPVRPKPVGSRTISLLRRDKDGHTVKLSKDEPYLEPENFQQKPTLATFSYGEGDDKRVYEMTKNNIVAGRGGADYWVDFLLDSSEAISGEHFRLRYDETSGRFFIKDVSTHGTKVNDKRIPLDKEYELPSKARINLASVLDIYFIASNRR